MRTDFNGVGQSEGRFDSIGVQYIVIYVIMVHHVLYGSW